MWPILLPIIARYGVEFAYKLWDTAREGGDPTEEQWEALRKLAAKSYDDYLEEARARASVLNPGVVPPTPPPL